MKTYVITLDTGTTNTRAYLWTISGELKGIERCEAGVRDTARSGTNAFLKNEIRKCLEKLVKNNQADFAQVEAVFASGMITSNVGVLEVPHLTAPASARQFAENVYRAEMPELCPVPIFFIRGLKNAIKDWNCLDGMDIMRGEEVETLALLENCPCGKKYVFVLPGSHTKFVFVNERQEITACLTSMTGELLEVLSKNTILADAVERTFASKEDYCREAVLEGYRTAKKQGFGRAAFLTRIYRMFGAGQKKEQSWASSYLLGTVLYNDAAALRSMQDEVKGAEGIIAGKAPFLDGLLDVLQEDELLESVRPYEAEDHIPLSAKGAFSVAKAWLRKAEV